MIGSWLMAPLLVAEVKSSLASWACPFVTTDPLVEGEAQRFSIRGFCHASNWDVHCGTFLLGFALLFPFALSFGHFVGYF